MIDSAKVVAIIITMTISATSLLLRHSRLVTVRPGKCVGFWRCKCYERAEGD